MKLSKIQQQFFDEELEIIADSLLSVNETTRHQAFNRLLSARIFVGIYESAKSDNYKRLSELSRKYLDLEKKLHC